VPLAANGAGVRFLAPIDAGGHRHGVDLVRLPRPTLFRRLATFAGLLAKLLRPGAAVYHFQDPQLLPVGLLLKLVLRKRVIYDAYEDFPSMAAQKRRIPRFLRPLAARSMAALENLAARRFDGIMTADPFTLRRFAHTGPSRKLVFYNFPNLDFFPPLKPGTKRFDVVYRGGLSERAGTPLLLSAIEMLAASARQVRVLLIGYFDSPAAETAIRGRIRLLGLEPLVEIRGRIDHEDMAAALSESRIGVSPLLPVPKFLLNIPVKIFEYWACGLPVVATDLPPIRPFVRSGDAAFLVPPTNAAELAQVIAWLLDHPQAAARMGAKGRELVEKRFNNSAEVRKLGRFVTLIARDGVRTLC